MNDRTAADNALTGLVELAHEPRDRALYSPSLAPTPIAERTWNRWHLAALWVGMAVCVPTYMMAASLVASGMNWWQAMLAILLGNLVVLAPMILCGHAGTRYGVPFPVFARAAFGVFGAHVPSLARALVACGWFGIQTYIGGEAISAMIGILWPAWLALGGGATFISLTLPSWICFFGFWLINVVFVWRGTESIKWLENFAAPFLIVVGLALLGWAMSAAGGSARSSPTPPASSRPSEYSGFSTGSCGVFLPGLTAMVGFWATLSLNIPDFTRYCQNQREQLLGQLYGLPTTMLLFSFIGVAVTSATVLLYGHAIWNPVDARRPPLARRRQPLARLRRHVHPRVATLSTNIAANVVGPANSIASAFPRASPSASAASSPPCSASCCARGWSSTCTSAGSSATPACSAPSAACCSPTTGSCAAPASTSPASTSPSGPYRYPAASTCAPSPPCSVGVAVVLARQARPRPSSSCSRAPGSPASSPPAPPTSCSCAASPADAAAEAV
jgi:NCS1 family nucleobase:cation symporter-1